MEEYTSKDFIRCIYWIYDYALALKMIDHWDHAYFEYETLWNLINVEG